MHLMTKGLNSSLKLPIDKTPLSFRLQTELVFRKFKEWLKLVSHFEAVSGSHFEIGAKTESFTSFSQAFESIEESTLLAANSSQDTLVISTLLKIHQSLLALMSKMSVFEEMFRSRLKMYVEAFLKVSKDCRYKSSLSSADYFAPEILSYSCLNLSFELHAKRLAALPCGIIREDFLQLAKLRMLSFKSTSKTESLTSKASCVRIEPIQRNFDL